MIQGCEDERCLSTDCQEEGAHGAEVRDGKAIKARQVGVMPVGKFSLIWCCVGREESPNTERDGERGERERDDGGHEDGRDPVREPLQVKRHVGYLPDSVGFYDNLTAADNMRYMARLIGLTPQQREERIKSSLEHVGLTGVADRRVTTFSRGMRQRLGLAEILMKEAQIAILDEPTSGLDPQATLELLDIIRNLKKLGVSVLLSSHLLERVQSVCDRVALFNEGKIVLIGTVAELGRQVLGGGSYVEIEAEGPGLADRLATVPGVRAVENTSPNCYRLLAEAVSVVGVDRRPGRYRRRSPHIREP